MSVVPQDLADVCNDRGITKEELGPMLAALLVITPGLTAAGLTAEQFAAVMGGAVSLTQINAKKAEIAQAAANRDAAASQATAAIQALNSQLAALQAQYDQQFGAHA